MKVSFFNNKENSVGMVTKLFSLLGMRVTTATITDSLFQHPHYPSMLCISDVLARYGIENISVKTTKSELYKIPVPCLAPIFFEGSEKLTIIDKIESQSISYYHPDSFTLIESATDEFLLKWRSGVLMLIDAENAVEEIDYIKKKKRETIDNALKYISIFILPSITIISSFLLMFELGTSPWISVFTLATLFGLTTCILLMLFEIGKDNPTLQQICKAGAKINCHAVINSKASKVFGIGWTSIGIVYFSGTLLVIFTYGLFNQDVFILLGALSLLALPYTIFSLFYQGRILKQWCALCLLIQMTLVFQAMCAVFGDLVDFPRIPTMLTLNMLVSLVSCYTVPTIFLSILAPILRSSMNEKKVKAELQRFKHNGEVFATLLRYQKEFNRSTDNLGIKLGNPNATHKIIKICNPFCGPCSKAHFPIEDLLENNQDVQLQIIFSVSNEDTRSAPVRHLLAVMEKYGEQVTRKALNDWYMSSEKNYETFALKYPLTDELGRQAEKVRAMDKWCEETEISFTPTIVINGHQLPRAYKVEDLKYLLSV